MQELNDATGAGPSDREPDPSAPSAPRPSRPPVSAGGPPPRLLPPEPPTSLKSAGRAWRIVAIGLGLALGLAFLALGKGRARLRELVVSQAPDASARDVDLATNIVLFGGLIVWALLAIAAVWLGRGIQRPRPTARLLAVLAWLVLLLTLAFTAIPLTDDHGLGLVARILLAGAALAATYAAIVGILPAAWRWIRQVKDVPAYRPGSGSPPGPEMPPPAR